MSRPWRDKGPKTSPPASSLVPAKAISSTTQRLLVTASFFVLQGIKLASDRTFSNFTLFSTLDVAFVYFLPVLAIPLLNFKPKVVFAQIIGLLLFNYSVFISADWIWALAWALIRPVFLSGKRTKHQNDLISGKYVVDILPEASAKLGTIAPLCVSPSDRNSEVYLQLSLSNTWPSAVALTRAELGSNDDYESLVIDKKQIAKLPSARGSPDSKLYIEVVKPGAYYLERIVDDHTGLRVKIERDRVVIPPCPTVDLVRLSDPNICRGTPFRAEVRAKGLAPLNVLVNGKWQTLGHPSENDRIVDERYEIVTEDSRPIEVTQVRDSLGLVTESQLKEESRIMNDAVATVPAHQKIALVGGSNNGGGSSVSAQFHVQGDPEDAPFRVKFVTPQDTVIELSVAKPGLQTLQVNEPGKYRLTEIHGARCGGRGSGEFEVFVPPPVSLDVDFKVIEDKCAGPTGTEALLKLAGTKPFKVGYRILKDGKRVVSQKVADFDRDTGVINFKPRDVGEYRYEIQFVEDQYRRTQFDTNDEKYYTTQTITELPGAQFLPLATTKLCGTSSFGADVEVRGRGPFTLKYSVDDQNEYTVSTEEESDVSQLHLDLDLPQGSHFIRLLSLTHRNGCVTTLPGLRTPDITVRPHIPHIKWEHPAVLKSAEPVNIGLPLSAESLTYPAKIVYERQYQGKSSRHELSLHKPEDVVKAFHPGTYRLLALNDGVCGGTVDSESVVDIGLYERPHIEVVADSVPDSICYKCSPSSQAKLRLFGEAPFTVIHEVVDPQGKSRTKTHELKDPELSFSLDTDLVGQYKHFCWIMDSRYPDFKQAQYTSLYHQVNALPEAVFASAAGAAAPSLHDKQLRVCENAQLPKPVHIALKGKAPFQLTVSIDEDIKVIPVEKASKLDLREYLGPFGTVGKSKIRLISVLDANGCRSSPSNANELDLEVFAQPEVPIPTKLDYCVGDKISAKIVKRHNKNAAGSFRVDYQWTGTKKSQHIQVPERHGLFEQSATRAGNLTVSSVIDSLGCQRKLDPPQLFARVHPLPRSTITEQPHFSIYQGEQISLGFAFEGTAPFSFKYVRRVNGKEVERSEVKDIMLHEYSMIVEEGGEYEIIELRDRYCRSER